MINRETLVKRIEKLPPYLLDEVSNYIDYIEFKRIKENIYKVEDITLESENSLSKDWLRPEEDEAWADLNGDDLILSQITSQNIYDSYSIKIETDDFSEGSLKM